MTLGAGIMLAAFAHKHIASHVMSGKSSNDKTSNDTCYAELILRSFDGRRLRRCF